MAQELIYTSARRGLRPGTRGYCTVAFTQGMRPECIRVLESLSAYKNPSSGPRVNSGEPPISYSHYRYQLGGRSASILSRIGPAAADHTNRDNKIAHHVVLSPHERPAAGPGWLCAQPAFFTTSWSGEPQRIQMPKPVPDGVPGPGPATAWAQAAGDAGWAASLAYAFLARPSTTTYLIANPDTDTLALTAEAMNLLPNERRWQVTFNTYFTLLPAGTNCLWRWCLPAAACLREAPNNAQALLIDLTQPLPAPKENPLTDCARQGNPLPPPRRRSAAASDPGRRRQHA